MSALEHISTTDHLLDHEPIEEWQNLSTAATAAIAELGSIGGADYGLWEMSTGAMRDVEGDEVFLVISGTGRIEFDEPARETIDLGPGTLVRLEEGMKTRWYVDGEPLRKLWIVPGEA